MQDNFYKKTRHGLYYTDTLIYGHINNYFCWEVLI